MNEKLIRQAFAENERNYSFKCPQLYIYDSVGSTNDVLNEYAKIGALEGSVAISDCQTNGHGRSGRSFYSPHGGNLYFSLLLRPRDVNTLELITPAAAVAVARAISKACYKEVSIKWVNDLFYNNRKICGILAQGYEIGTINQYVILGIGVNVHVGIENVPEDIKDIYGALYTDVEKEKIDGIIANLAAAIFSEYMQIYNNIDESDFIEEYKERSMVIGHKVTYVSGESTHEVRVVDIDKRGRIVVEDENGLISTFSDGEIRIKLSL